MFVFDFFDIDNHDVFISYAKKDATRIKPLRDALTAAGIKYWIDDRIDGSENFLAEIPDAIKKCSIVLFVASQNSANSEWTQKELLYARNQKKEIFPYKLDDFQFENCAELDFFFTNIQWKESVEDVVAGLRKKLGIDIPTQTLPSVMKHITGTLVIKADLDCRVFNYGEEIGVAKAGEYTKFELPLGDNELKYVGLESEEDSYEEPETIVIRENQRTSVKVTLLYRYNTRKIKEEAERKAKRDAYLLGLPDEAFVEYREDEKSGFKLRSTGEVVIPSKYDDKHWLSYTFSEGLAAVKLNGKWGYIDKTGKEVISLNYDYVGSFSDGLAEVKLNGKWGCVDKTGKEVIPLKYEAVGSQVIGNLKDGLVDVKLNGKWGCVDKTGKEVIPLKYDEVWSFSEGLARVNVGGKMDYVGRVHGGKYGFIDKTGKEIIPLKYDEVWSFSEGLAPVKLNDRWGCVDKTGKEVIPLKYDYVASFCDGLASARLKGKRGYIDKTGKEAISFKYDNVWSFSEGLACVKLNGKWGFIDKTGKEVIPLKYDYVSSFCDDLASVGLNGKYGFIDKTGKEVISLNYVFVMAFTEGLAAVKFNDKWGFIDKTGKEVIPLKYDVVGSFCKGFAAVELNGERFLIDEKGTRVK